MDFERAEPALFKECHNNSCANKLHMEYDEGVGGGEMGRQFGATFPASPRLVISQFLCYILRTVC